MKIIIKMITPIFILKVYDILLLFYVHSKIYSPLKFFNIPILTFYSIENNEDKEVLYE